MIKSSPLGPRYKIYIRMMLHINFMFPTSDIERI